MAKNVSWHYYGDGFNAAAAGKPNQFCPICNPMQYSANIMGSAAGRANNKDVTDFFDDLNNGTVPSVSIIKPSGFVDGHPQSSKFDLFEAFVKNIVDAVQACLGLQDVQLAATRSALRKTGNTSSAGIIFVLEELAASLPSPAGRGLILGLGPGLTVELLELAWGC